MAFTKILLSISCYRNTDIVLSLINTISLNLHALVLNTLLFRFYFKNRGLNKFILYNIVIYLINSSIFLICTYNMIDELQNYELFILFHYIYILCILEKNLVLMTSIYKQSKIFDSIIRI